MTWEVWLGFVAASLLVLVVPGPTLMLVIGRAVQGERKTALMLGCGVALGDLAVMTLSLVGLGAILAASAQTFQLVKFVGGLYLLFLGARALWKSRKPLVASATPPSSLRSLSDAFWVTLFNPKGISFFVAFLPLFISTERAFLPQALILVATFVSLAFVNAVGFGLLARRLGAGLKGLRAQSWMQRVSGGVFVTAGLWILAARR